MSIKKLNEEILKVLNEGATDRFYSCDDISPMGIKQAFNDKVENDREEYGSDSYNGSFTTFDGIKILNKEFNDSEEAKKYILNNQKKWGPALAVIIKNNKDSWRKGETFGLFGGWAAT